MAERPPEPYAVSQLVEQYVSTELADAAQYSNRTPLDESGIWSLHALAAEVYALGWREGALVADDRESRAARRHREADLDG
ncbi:hypothetical protein KVF89_22470 [Nocardioides carbamazepini]|uniref:hypothetical protein n=1 Tax=Nocardioides carbamazepini TaxID=2854259 RepID=UPI00214A7C9F|nr:hypothetical protein [Nocardioides carbamazepini]MCR1785322.1 hypothetical protein [Nocardioides carbamazepini]